MKKKICLVSLIVLILATALFVLTGCGNDANSNVQSSADLHKLEFVDMRYNDPKNFTKKDPYNLDENKVINYTFIEEDKSINLYYNKDRDYSFGVDQNAQYQEKTINGITWRVYHDNDFGVEYETYYYVYNNNLYRIELNGVDKYQSDFDEFMNTISFK